MGNTQDNCGPDIAGFCNALDNCPTIGQLKATDQQIRTWIKNVEDKIELRNPMSDNQLTKGLKQRMEEAEACCTDNLRKMDELNRVI